MVKSKNKDLVSTRILLVAHEDGADVVEYLERCEELSHFVFFRVKEDRGIGSEDRHDVADFLVVVDTPGIKVIDGRDRFFKALELGIPTLILQVGPGSGIDWPEPEGQVMAWENSPTHVQLFKDLVRGGRFLQEDFHKKALAHLKKHCEESGMEYKARPNPWQFLVHWGPYQGSTMSVLVHFCHRRPSYLEIHRIFRDYKEEVATLRRVIIVGSRPLMYPGEKRALAWIYRSEPFKAIGLEELVESLD